MKKVCLAVFVSILLSCNQGSGNLDEKDYEKSKKKLEKKEKDNPLDFLMVYAIDKKNVIGQTVVNGTIQNKASVSSYKNVRVKMLFYREGAQVENHEEVIDDVVPANGSVKFKSKYFTPKGTDSVALSVMSAKAVKD